MKLKLPNLSISQTILLTYMTLILLGGGLLTLPIAAANGEATSFVDAVFTATSAVCVTGQVTLNTATHWSPFGKTVIISLIEIGGLGFMTLWMLVFHLNGHTANIRQRKLVYESLNLSWDYDMREVVLYIVRFTLGTQALGAILLALRLVPDLGWQRGVLYSIFHSISAFNNAGFDLFGDSLIGFQHEPYVINVIGFLIFSGSLGFLVWRDILTYFRNRKLLRYTKLVLITTAVLLITSSILFGITEGLNGTFTGLNPFEWVSNIVFLAVTPRTAGYANIDYAMLSKGGIFLTLILMFIGGSSGSTAGGVKTSTIAVLFIFLLNYFRGRPVMVFNRELKTETIRKALFMILSGFTLIIISTFILMLTEEIPPGMGIEYILVEVISCFGTVGLTMGLTPHLTSLGKLLLILLMFIGKVGLITFLWSIGNHDKQWQVKYPEINIMIG